MKKRRAEIEEIVVLEECVCQAIPYDTAKTKKNDKQPPKQKKKKAPKRPDEPNKPDNEP